MKKPHNPKNVEENQENQQYDESASFLFYVLYTDRIITYWTDVRDDPKANSTFFNGECIGYAIHRILLACGIGNDNSGIV
jgi:hypothetical protein